MSSSVSGSEVGRTRTQSEGVDACSVCHDPFEVFAIGPCDHPVCFRCSTRMRVLCETNDCPICRSAMPQVAFIYERKLFKDIVLRGCIPNRKFKIFFQDEDVEDRYLDLLEYCCKICRNRTPDKTFTQLQTHMRREHQLFNCDLCVSHIQIFPFERKFYTRKDLATHRRIGDPDDKSYKGHPLCEFCDTRFNDKDELLKHLRKDHYFCHFCDQQCSNAYYDQYPDLMKHFGEAHFLCTEGDCGNPDTRFTHAFVSDIDLKAHNNSEHNKNLSKAQAREARTIEVDFQLAPRKPVHNRGSVITNNDYEDTRSNNSGGRGQRYNRRRDQEDEELKRALEASKVKSSPPVEERVPDPVKDFPTLSGAPASKVSIPVNAFSPPTRNQEDFPSLSSTVKSAPISQGQSKSAYSSAMHFQQGVKPSAPVKKISKPVSLGSVSRPVSAPKGKWLAPASAEDYPSLGSARPISANPTPNVTTVNWIDNTAQSGIATNKQTTQTSNKYNRTLSNKTMNDVNEFPTLGGKSKSESLRNSLLSDWKKPESDKKKVVPKAQKFDDSFEVPNSYTKTSAVESAIKKNNTSESSWQLTNGVASLSVAPQDFPVLLQKTRDTGGGSAPEKKKKKNKKKKADENSTVSTKVGKDVNASLNEIALGLMDNGQDTSSSTKQNGSSNIGIAKKVVKKPQKVDWFDNPPVEYTSTLNEEVPKKEIKPTKKTKTEEATKKTKTEEAAFEKPVDSFPSLHTMSTSVQHPKPPPGFSSDSPPSNVSVLSAPPGFSAQPSNGSATPTPSTLSNSVFSEPPNFKSRNLQLIQDIRTSLSTSEDGFTHFKAFSGQFRQGLMAASDYYYSCQLIMGDKDFANVYPELVALLPDINLQVELYQVHQIVGTATLKSQELSVCTVCGQVVLSQDSDHHRQGHGMDLNDYPSLGGKAPKSNSNTKAPVVSGKGAWIRAK